LTPQPYPRGVPLRRPNRRGTPDKPGGTVWLAARVHTATRVVKRVFPGDRDEIRRRAAQAALDLLRRLLVES